LKENNDENKIMRRYEKRRKSNWGLKIKNSCTLFSENTRYNAIFFIPVLLTTYEKNALFTCQLTAMKKLMKYYNCLKAIIYNSIVTNKQIKTI